MIPAVLGALLVGVALGLLGAGGAILTTPILRYLLGHGDKAAVAEALAIVGAISLVSAVRLAVQRRVVWSRVLLFGPAGIAGAIGGSWAAAAVPGQVQFATLAAVMLAAAIMMFRGVRSAASSDSSPDDALRSANPGALLAQGLGVGFLTGFVGVGGGFLIVPALVLLGGVPMRLAVGTSLAIITMNCASGLLSTLRTLPATGQRVDWTIVAIFAGVGVAGSVLGSTLGNRLDQRTLRRLFALLLVPLAAYVLWRELPRLL